MSYVTGRTIKELREKRKITQKELSEKIGVSDKTVSKWETRKGLPLRRWYDLKPERILERIFWESGGFYGILQETGGDSVLAKVRERE